MINYSLIEKILDYAISHGGDYAEVFEEETEKTQLTVLNEKVTNVLVGTESGIGIRVLSGTESRYFYTSSQEEAVLLGEMKNLLQNMKRTLQLSQSCAIPNVPIHYGEAGGKRAHLKEKLQLLNRCNRAGMEAGSYIVKMKASYLNMNQLVRIANTKGCYAEDERIKTRLFINAYAKDGDEVRESYIGPGAMRGYEFCEYIQPEDYARYAASSAEALLHSRSCPTGRMPVIIGNGFGGLFFHEACGHSLEASSMAECGSEFSGKIGQKIASEKVTLIDDGTLKHAWGSLHIDDEGVPTRKNVLIEHGVLKGCLSDRLDGRKLGIEPTGSARRQNYRFVPVSRMTNTYIVPGTDLLEDMIASVERGLYVKHINGGSVHSATGEFNFNTNETFWIENGKIVYPVHNATLIGIGGEILKRVEMVGNDYDIGQGFCYADSGALYIGAGQPSVKIAKMTVGGDAVC